MLELVIPPVEYYDEELEEFIDVPGYELQLEHSLVAISKWESKYEKPFLHKMDERTDDELRYYIWCMCIDPPPNDHFTYSLNEHQIGEINTYINKRHTATWFAENSNQGPRNQEIITSEVIYYWMVTFKIPFECQTWNITRLLTLIRIINLKSQPEKKMSRAEASAKMRALNRERQARYNTKG